jgi:hypothetical protein
MRPTIILEHFRMALIKLAKLRKDCPSSWLTQKLIKRSARTKAPVPYFKMITETSLLPLNTLITSVKESNN